MGESFLLVCSALCSERGLAKLRERPGIDTEQDGHFMQLIDRWSVTITYIRCLGTGPKRICWRLRF